MCSYLFDLLNTMIKGYKCNYCLEFDKDQEKIRVHELTCSFNPCAKSCHTCKHWNDGIGYGNEYLGDSCKRGVKEDDRDDIHDGKPCELWES